MSWQSADEMMGELEDRRSDRLIADHEARMARARALGRAEKETWVRRELAEARSPGKRKSLSPRERSLFIDALCAGMRIDDVAKALGFSGARSKALEAIFKAHPKWAAEVGEADCVGELVRAVRAGTVELERTEESA